MIIFSGTSHPDLARDIAEFIGQPLGQVEIHRFPDDELFVRIKENIRGGDVFIIQSIGQPPNEALMELLIMIDAAKRASASRITAVIPYFGYARQDRKDQPRVPSQSAVKAGSGSVKPRLAREAYSYRHLLAGHSRSLGPSLRWGRLEHWTELVD